MNCIIKIVLARLIFAIIILIPGIKNVKSQNKQVYSVKPISLGVYGGLNLTYLNQDTDIELSTAKLPIGGINISFTTKNKFETRFRTSVLNSGYNVESPFTKVRLLLLSFQLTEYYTFYNFFKFGIGISNNLPLYGSKKNVNGAIEKFTEKNQFNGILSCELLLNQNYNINIQYAKVLMNEKYSFLQIGFILWFIRSQNER